MPSQASGEAPRGHRWHWGLLLHCREEVFGKGHLCPQAQKAKDTRAEVLGKGQPRGFGKVLWPSGTGFGKVLWPSAKGFGKVLKRKVILTPAPGAPGVGRQDLEKSSASANKPLVVVDWHNTVEIDNDVSGRNAYALTMLAQRARVVILSYVATKKREEEALSQMKGLPHWKMGTLHNSRVCWRKCGLDGKTHIATDLAAVAIFDDSKEICQEALEWGLQIYPIRTKWETHKWLEDPQKESHSSFAEAVDSFIKYNFFG